MKKTGVWTIKTLPKAVFHKDFLIFIENKWEYQDPFGEHIYLPLTIWAKTHHITPPGEIAEDYEQIRQILEETGADMFTLLDNKQLLGLKYMKEDVIRVLQLDRRSVTDEFFQFIEPKYEYKGVDGDHLYSLESVWLNTKETIPDGCIKGQYFELRKQMRESACDLFDFTNDL